MRRARLCFAAARHRQPQQTASLGESPKTPESAATSLELLFSATTLWAAIPQQAPSADAIPTHRDAHVSIAPHPRKEIPTHSSQLAAPALSRTSQGIFRSCIRLGEKKSQENTQSSVSVRERVPPSPASAANTRSRQQYIFPGSGGVGKVMPRSVMMGVVADAPDSHADSPKVAELTGYSAAVDSVVLDTLALTKDPSPPASDNRADSGAAQGAEQDSMQLFLDDSDMIDDSKAAGQLAAAAPPPPPPPLPLLLLSPPPHLPPFPKPKFTAARTATEGQQAASHRSSHLLLKLSTRCQRTPLSKSSTMMQLMLTMMLMLPGLIMRGARATRTAWTLLHLLCGG